MIPREIDLTERGDFGGTGIVRGIDISTLLETSDGDSMTNDDYGALMAHEKIFGRRRHPNSWKFIFDSAYLNDEEFYERHKYSCARCGARIIPWTKYIDLCPRCEEDLAERIPWKPVFSVHMADRTMDVFDLR